MRLLVPRLAAAAPVALGDTNGRDANTIVVVAAAAPVALGDANGRDANTIVVAPTTTNTGNDNDDAGDAVAIVRAKCGFRDNKGSNMQLLRRRCCQ